MSFTVPDSVRYALITWSVISTILSLLGNTIVLISSRKHNALKLDQYSIRLIDNLAAADIGYTLTGIIPTISAIAAEGWIYGPQICVADRYLTNVFYNITPLLVALLCVSKLTCIMSPLSVVTRDTKHVLLAVSAIWALVVTSCLISTLVYRDNVYYDHISYQCWVDYTHREYFGTFLIIYMIVVAAVIITTTIWLLVLARRLTGGTQTKGATAIIAVAAIYSLATVPTAAMMAVELTVWYASWSDDAKALGKIITMYSFYLTNFCNPIVYYFSIRSFREFVDKKIFRRGELPSPGNTSDNKTVSTAKTPLLGDRKDHNIS